MRTRVCLALRAVGAPPRVLPEISASLVLLLFTVDNHMDTSVAVLNPTLASFRSRPILPENSESLPQPFGAPSGATKFLSQRKTAGSMRDSARNGGMIGPGGSEYSFMFAASGNSIV
jgi:hypothetical protein